MEFEHSSLRPRACVLMYFCLGLRFSGHLCGLQLYKMATLGIKGRIGNLDYKPSAVKQAACEAHLPIDRRAPTRSNIFWEARDTIIDPSFLRMPIRTSRVSNKVILRND